MPQCNYRRRDGSLCPEEAPEGSSFCFWHDDNVGKKGEEVKKRLEEKAKRDPNCQGYKLRGADLFDVWLTETDFTDADFSKAKMMKGHLFGINLTGANLFKANCSNANFRYASMREVNVLGTTFDNARLESVDWGDNFVILQELAGDLASKQGNGEEAKNRYKEAEEIYLTLKTHFNNKGNTKNVGIFFYREMIVQRRQLPLFSAKRLFLKLADVTCGYGEKVWNIFSFSLGTILLNAFIFMFGGVNSPHGMLRITNYHSVYDIVSFYFDMVYYSIVTFTTLGYGEYTPASAVTKFFAGIEAFMGPFLVSLFVITVSKNLMSRT